MMDYWIIGMLKGEVQMLKGGKVGLPEIGAGVVEPDGEGEFGRAVGGGADFEVGFFLKEVFEERLKAKG